MVQSGWRWCRPDPQGRYALNQASSAVATANAASAAVSAAAFYTHIAALANLPSSPANETV